jgi:ubiquinone/menaquinone biosynthesis C-methylase UbiE
MSSLCLMQDEKLIAEFTHQAESFNAAAVPRAAEVLDGLVRLAAPQPHQRWLDVACGPGIVTRKLATHVREVHGGWTSMTGCNAARQDPGPGR